MFRKLRNKFVLTTVVATSAILVVAFGAIYGLSALVMSQRPTEFPRFEAMEESFKTPNDSVLQELREAFGEEIQAERDSHLGRLATTLVAVGLATEMLVFLASYYFAEKWIAPVKAAYDYQREFIANASHELKTPIAAIQANFEALGATEEPWVSNIETELMRADSLVKNLLALARTDGRAQVAAKKDVNIAKMVKKRAQLIEARLEDKKLDLQLPEKAAAKITEADAVQILDIFLDNAVKYSDKNIRVSATEKGFVVANDGRKISSEKLARVFERFYQVDKTAEGSGLGLAIAKAVADKNGWKIWAESDKKETRFNLTF